MPSFLTLDGVVVTTPDTQALLSELTLSFGPGRHGVIGRNGCGKSTLFNMIAGERPVSSGAIARSGPVHLMRQTQTDPSQTVAGSLGLTGPLALLERLADGRGSVADAAEANWTLPERLDQALFRAGLEGVAAERPIATLSGGQQMRVALAGAWLSGADILLLDEPTNNMDAEGRALVRALIDGWAGPVLIASHDRALLDQVDRIVDLDAQPAVVYGGGWSDYAAEREARRARAVAAQTKAEAVLGAARAAQQTARERQARRDGRGQKARATGSMPKMWHDRQMERAQQTAGRSGLKTEAAIEKADAALREAADAVERLLPLHMALGSADVPPGRRMLELSEAVVSAGGHDLGPWSLTLTGPERLALTGPNGVGKSTLLRLIAGEIAVSRGSVTRHARRIAWLDQDLARLGQGGALHEVLARCRPDLSAHEVRATLARFGFRAGAGTRDLAVLSGGERLRLGLAAAFGGAQAPDLLLLDEPTNHLDLRAMEELESTLGPYDGALIVVSHDPVFLGKIGVTRQISLDFPRKPEGKPAKPG
ncbi:ABC-F family ATP-binding cassette domain-containing protein [Pseudooceanicola sp. C21-150M6]|uniref:ABC-F family ATP-binding cassette domain-containing protein n=1 Tax=Pseudooceanicola sp. C21-150M6 TaxID=3434355 RepID=UPI003D7FD0BD